MLTFVAGLDLLEAVAARVFDFSFQAVKGFGHVGVFRFVSRYGWHR
jgi:hypothetical protein